MHLGAFIARLENERDAAEAIEAFGDLVLFAAVASAAERYGESPGAYVAASVSGFAATAGDAEWLGLVAAMERAEDPGRAALRRMLGWALARDREETAASAEGCSCSGATFGGPLHGT